ncbi:sigma-70 family RNA polymerase sigma factor [Nibrella saemangeumensis]|uniref:Sigma-70 family RNA polymerase sigma factor n=1 Tax=Nibrella saemangeumensis TaxID=1084526 RepID=A0ABP8NKA2_9BACT
MTDLNTQKEFEQQIHQYGALIHNVCRIYAATEADRQDLYQEIVIQLWHSFGRFKGQAKFSTWLYRVAINTAITGLRRQKKGFIRSYEPEGLPTQVTEEKSTDEEQWQQLYQAISQLNEIEKAIVMLYLEDRSYEEMEDIVGISQGNLRVKMTRIKDKLRQLVKQT